MLKMKKKTMALVLAAAMGTSVLAGCSKQPDPGTVEPQSQGENQIKEQPAGEQPDQDAGKKTLTIALASEIGGLDPVISVDRYGGNVYLNIYETLMKVNDKGEIVPNLCTSFEQPDEKTYVFHLPEGVKFHNGEELKASDVAFSLKRGIGTKMDYLVGSIDPDSFSTPDDYTVTFSLKSPSGAFMANLTTPQTGILSEKAVTEAGDQYGLHPIGSGPYKFVSWTKGVSAILERFDEYHGTAPYYDELVFKTLPEDTTRTIELESRGVDVATAIAPVDIPRIEDSEEFNLITSPTRGLKWLSFNTQKEPWNNEKVRQAVALALDTESITRAVKLGYAETATSMLSPNVMYFNPDIPVNEYNVEKAKALLAEAGYPNGLNTTILVDERTEMQNAGTIIKEMLAQINVNADIEVLEWAAFLNKLFDGDMNIFLQSWNCSTPDPDNQFYSTFHSSMAGSPGGHAHINDKKVDEILDTARESTVGSEREKLYKELQQYNYDEKYWVPLWYDVDYIGTTKEIGDLSLDSGGYHNWFLTQPGTGN